MMNALFALALLPAVVQDGKISHNFELKLDRPVKSVNLAGTFNNWDRNATPMVQNGNLWRVTLRLPAGKHQYKFVIDGSEWIPDPKGKSENDGGGNINSVLMLMPGDYAKPAKAGDGVIAKSALLHETKVPGLNWDRGQLSITFRTRPGDLDHLEMFVEDPAGEKCVELHEVARDSLYATYQAKFAWNRSKDIRYRFMLVDGAKRVYYSPNGLSEQPGKPFVLNAKTFKPFITPSWVEKSVFYQIFPDRFANGDQSNDPSNVMPWDGAPTYSNRFGGDVAGIKSHVGYLKQLGVTGIYFNPVFQSPSNHRYDATDYLKVDKEFGTNAEFFALTKELKASGIRSMMDFAFNHTAVDFSAFLDIRKNGKESKFKDWYWIKEYPVEVRENPPYVAWFGFPSMPKLNVMNPATHAYVLSVVDFWRKNGSLDGIRLDVANEVDMQMWRDLRRHVKASAPETYILGEEWGNASNWLQGDQWDASMNYAFRDACLRFFAEQNITAKECLQRLMANYALYAPQVSRNQYNLLSSHDTPRFVTLCGGDQTRTNLAAIVLFTWTGTPSIYYGEELGMQGGKDPENRRGMEWEKATDANPTLKLYKKLVALRKNSVALQSGDPVALPTSNDLLAFARVHDKEQVLVAVNRSTTSKIWSLKLPTSISARRFTNVLSNEKVSAKGDSISISIPPMSAAILRSVGSHSHQPRGLAFTLPARIQTNLGAWSARRNS